MANSFEKTYSVTVTYKLDGGGEIADDDLNPSILREQIIKRIGEACKISKGILHSRPSTVSEA